MEKFIIQFKDFTDQESISGLSLTTSVWVAPVFKFTRDPDGEEGEELRLYKKKMSRHPSFKAISRIRRDDDTPSTGFTAPDFTRAEKLNNLPCTVDQRGNCQVQIDLAGMFQLAMNKKRDGQDALGVIGIIHDMDIQSGLFNRVTKNFSPLFHFDAGDSFTYSEQKFLVLIDRCTTIIGHSNTTSTRLWFQVYGDDLDGLYYCRVTPINSGAVHTDHRLQITTENFYTGSVRITGLEPGREYRYELIYSPHPNRTGPGPGSHTVTKGVFTLPKDNKVKEFLFASCNKPIDPDDPFNRWEKLARERKYDFMLFLGDQIYEDGIQENSQELNAAINIADEIRSWEKQYVKNYSAFWKHPSIRKTLRNKPVYMIHDDHEIMDDFGVRSFQKSKFDHSRFPQIEAGLHAYQLFQHTHNPDGTIPTYDSMGNPILDFRIQKENVSFYVLNTRSNRPSISPTSSTINPVLGKEQYTRFLEWSNSNEVQNSDIVFVSIPIPPVFLPAGLITNILNSTLARAILSAKHYGAEVYNFLEENLLGDLGLPGKLVAGYYAGLAAVISGLGSFFGFGDDGADEEIDNIEQEIDLKERLDYRENQRDLKSILDILFNLSEGNTRVKKNRAVFILSGDVHLGGFHKIHKRQTGAPNGFSSSILQITSSGVSHTPGLTEQKIKAFSDIIDDYASNITSTLGALFAGGIVPAILINRFGVTHRVKIGEQLTEKLRNLYFKLFFPLDSDSTGSATYFGQPEDLLLERNFGRVRIEEFGNRKYRFYFTVEGATDALQKALEVNLNEENPVYHDLFGRVEKIQGKISYLRVHEPGSDFGDSVNHTNDEVIVMLNNKHDCFYHFPLNTGTGSLVSQMMFETLQKAAFDNQPINIEYKRNSINGSKIIRLY
ncbi:MAG: alkaline phosphatase D family protein [Chitinophagaceae bacterium]|nr:alkaline phosphatase D family protein [Chitinophagaceae bacterium]MBP8243424.1 alkaline phosphatase D family protein [Chitinophagaceae bacterium]